MIILAYIVIAFTGIQLIVSLLNFIFRQPLDNSRPSEAFVSVMIPARNEEENIPNLLKDLQDQKHNNIEILVFDDESTDRTGEIVKQYSNIDPRIKLVSSGGLPDGWLGKNHACHSLANHAKGEYFMFVDADVRIGNNLIVRAINKVAGDNLSLLTIFPKQIMPSIGEKLTVPLMNYILLSLLPLILVSKSKEPGLSAANGQFMFFSSAAYRKYHPHKKMRMKKVEDIAIIRYLKRKGLRAACLSEGHNISCRMYTNYHDAVNGFAKNIIMFFGGSAIMAILFWMITSLGFLPVIIMMPAWLIMIYFAALIIIRIFVSLTSRQPVAANIIFLLPQHIVMGLIIMKSIEFKKKGQYKWKGRNLS